MRLRRRVPFVQQQSSAECGLACMAMVARFHGVKASLPSLQDSVGFLRDGLSAEQMLDVGAALGFEGEAVEVDVESLDLLPAGSVLHWEGAHYVVFERVTAREAVIVDPAVGRRGLPLARVREALSGVALVFERAAGRPPAWAAPSALPADMTRAVFGRKRDWALGLAAAGAIQAVTIATPILTGHIVDRVNADGPSSLVSLVAAAAAGSFATLLGLHFLRSWALLRYRVRSNERLSTAILSRVLRAPFAYLQTRSTADLGARVDGLLSMREVVTLAVVSSLLDGGLTLGYLTALLVRSPRVAAVLAAVAALQAVAAWVSVRLQRDLRASALHHQTRAQQAQYSIIEGAEIIKAMGLEGESLGRYGEVLRESVGATFRAGRILSMAEATSAAVVASAPVLLLAVGLVDVGAGVSTLGGMIANNAIALAFLYPFNGLVRSASEIGQTRAYFDHLGDILLRGDESRAHGARRASLRGALRAEGLTYRPSRYAEPIVAGVTVDITAGSTVAILGPTGAGKTTLGRLLIGLLHATEGKLFFDEHDFLDLDLIEARRQIALVTQRPMVFPSTVLDNVRWGCPGATREEVEGAARAARLHDEIMAMPLGYATPLAGADSLSGGQAQRLSLARALLRRPRVLLLDEAGSNLDVETERAIMAALRSLDCTKLVITHRPATAREADQVLVVDRGRLVECGRPDDLARGQGYYARSLAQADAPRA